MLVGEIADPADLIAECNQISDCQSGLFEFAKDLIGIVPPACGVFRGESGFKQDFVVFFE